MRFELACWCAKSVYSNYTRKHMENNTFPNYVARQKGNKINARLGSPIACDFKNMLENQCKISISANANTQNTSHLNIGFADLPRCAHKPSPEAQQMLEVDIKKENTKTYAKPSSYNRRDVKATARKKFIRISHYDSSNFSQSLSAFSLSRRNARSRLN